MNMAQLHSLNVTCDFVREAFSEYGVRFEMSNDGQKVRWKVDSRLRSTNVHTVDSSRRRMTTLLMHKARGKESRPHDIMGIEAAPNQTYIAMMLHLIGMPSNIITNCANFFVTISPHKIATTARLRARKRMTYPICSNLLTSSR